ncbi:MAG: hypothetical protein COA86_03485 [Kangiella sp.]|nr:MAG: hypothetical protein COA86_03485 [Kangiella sp.]
MFFIFFICTSFFGCQSTNKSKTSYQTPSSPELIHLLQLVKLDKIKQDKTNKARISIQRNKLFQAKKRFECISNVFTKEQVRKRVLQSKYERNELILTELLLKLGKHRDNNDL